jgi:hypothetical protein
MKSVFVTAAVAAFLAPAQAWWNNGHMITARIAYDELTEKNPEVLAQANKILAVLEPETQFEKDHSFVESATFPDRFKHHGFADLAASNHVNVHGPWHFVDNPFFDGYTTDVKENDMNVTTAINTLTEKMYTAGEDRDSSYQLRCLIHYVGDIHQPLHASSRYSPDFKRGDRGGNSFKLQRKDGISELHALWDSVVTKYADDWNEPLNADGWKNTGDASTDIRNTFPRGRLFLTNKDPASWGAESLYISENFVYKGLEENTWPSAEYISMGEKIAMERLAYGGYRLADILVEAFAQKGEKSEETKFLW